MDTPKPTLILSIDDDPDIRNLVERFLKGTGYQVLTADNVNRAFEILQTNKPDLILLDVSMPEMNGYDFCAKLQEKKELMYLPVIFLTAFGGEQNKLKAFSAGAVDFLTKPVTKTKLLSTVERHLKTKSQWNELGKKRLISEEAQKSYPDFNKFRKFLADLLHLEAEQKKKLANVAPYDLYTLCFDFSITRVQMAQYIAQYLNLPYLSSIEQDNLILGILPSAFCKANHILSIQRSELKPPSQEEFRSNAFVLSNPFDWELMDFIKKYISQVPPWEMLITEPENITSLLEEKAKKMPPKPAGIDKISMSEIEKQLYTIYSETEKIAFPEDATEESKPIILFVNKVIEDAYRQGASDIHIEPWEKELVIRYRIDGHLRIVMRIRSQNLFRPVIARLKIMSKLNITERRLPQDGRIIFKEFNRKNLDFDLRLSITPMNFGEKAVLRILDKQKSVLPLDRLGFSERNLEIYREKIQTPYGMILHVGPTGSGKSMTLYAALNEIQTPEINIQTAEDPIEYTLEGINQLQIQHEIGLDFGRALRSFLRQDPDVILVGEIRDFETAKIAVEAALTGHMLFSTLHTNDAASTITRFLEIGIPSFMISSSIVLVCAQRLLRRLCKECKEPYSPEREMKDIIGVPPESPIQIYRPKGCRMCNRIGYKGRIGVHEILVPNENLRKLINQKEISSETIKRKGVEECAMTTLYWDAMEKVRKGFCSVEDVLGEVRVDDFDSRPLWMFEELKLDRTRCTLIRKERITRKYKSTPDESKQEDVYLTEIYDTREVEGIKKMSLEEKVEVTQNLPEEEIAEVKEASQNAVANFYPTEMYNTIEMAALKNALQKEQSQELTCPIPEQEVRKALKQSAEKTDLAANPALGNTEKSDLTVNLDTEEIHEIKASSEGKKKQEE